MARNLFAKGGIPVWAFSSPDGVPRWPCSLAAKYNEADREATISLQLPDDTHGALVLHYAADSLIPDRTPIQGSTLSTTQDEIDYIARGGNARLAVLSLHLKTPCSIWSSSSLESLHGVVSLSLHAKELASAPAVHLLFDHNHLHPENRSRLERIISRPEELRGLPDAFYSGTLHKLVAWSGFGLAVDEESEAPPSYTAASNKRQGESSCIQTKLQDYLYNTKPQPAPFPDFRNPDARFSMPLSYQHPCSVPYPRHRANLPPRSTSQGHRQKRLPQRHPALERLHHQSLTHLSSTQLFTKRSKRCSQQPCKESFCACLPSRPHRRPRVRIPSRTSRLS